MFLLTLIVTTMLSIMLRHILFAGFLTQGAAAQKQQFVPRPGYFPPTGDDTIAGGIFCISLPDLGLYLARNGGMQLGSEAVAGTAASDPGSGAWPAHMFTDASLPKHTLYAPKSPPKDQKLPFIAFGNGACGTNGAGYENFLLEIASHGYIIAADGDPKVGGLASSLGAGFNPAGGQSKVSDMVESVNWALGPGANKFGQIDPVRIATMGHSCGGLEAMSVAYHNPKIKFMVLLNIAIFQDNKRYLLKELKAPVAWFVGGPKDMGYPNANKDYDLLPEGLPAFKASLDTGHMGQFFAKRGGKTAKAVLAFLEWQFRSDDKSKKLLLDEKSSGSLVSDRWNVTFKNWK